MHKLLKNLAFASIALALTAGSIFAQDTKVIANSDGSYTVIEYPADKDVQVKLMSVSGVSGTGMAHVIRTSNGTKVMFDVTGAPADWKDVYAYAVDPSGSSTLLGPITFTNGVGKADFTTPGNQFMLVLAPTGDLTTFDPSASYYFRSEVTAGYKIVPRGKVLQTANVMTVDSNGFTYDVPMLGITKYRDKTSEVRLKFNGEMSGLQAKAYLKPVGGKTQIRMTFDDLQKTPMNKRIVLWISGPQGYTKIGQIIHAGKKDTSEIRGETALDDFGLFLTAEDIDVDRPTSRVYSAFSYTPD